LDCNGGEGDQAEKKKKRKRRKHRKQNNIPSQGKNIPGSY